MKVERMNAILVDATLGVVREYADPEEAEFRKELDKEVAEIRAAGREVYIPDELPGRNSKVVREA